MAETKRRLLEFLIELAARRQADRRLRRPGKGNTLLNYCGIRPIFLDYTVDRNPYKHGNFLPGHPHPDPSRRSTLAETRPDYVLILPWNLKDEIVAQLVLRPRVGRPVRSCRSPTPSEVALA